MKGSLAISTPGSSGLRYYSARQGVALHFRFVPFTEGRALELPMEEVQPENMEIHWAAAGAKPRVTSQKAYLKLLENCLDYLREGHAQKVVCSRAAWHSISVDPLTLVRQLAAAYPEACVYFFSHPRAGTWLGASPEVLLDKRGGQLRSMSLAGTQRQAESFSAKEEEEQGLVTQYIRQVFENSPGLHKVEVLRGEKVAAGPLHHLRNWVQARAGNGLNLNLLLSQLHPTPAVAGVPRAAALQFLQQHEAYERSYYSGYFGWREGDRAHYWVNLRCLQAWPDGVALYAGGGITAQSQPAAEWEETEAKMRVVLDILKNSP